MNSLLVAVGIAYGTMSLITFTVYSLDKRAARLGRPSPGAS